MEKVRIRIKALEELSVKSQSWNLCWNRFGKMDYLFGKELYAFKTIDGFEIKDINGSVWLIPEEMADIIVPTKSPSKLESVLNDALKQATVGKGKERHADDNEFIAQPIFWIEKHFKSFQLGQAVKKVHESQRLDKDKAVAELLGAINYIAAHIIHLQGE